MSEFAFFPALPFPAEQLMLFGVLLLAGLVGGELVRRYLFLPKITGYVIIGVLLGQSGLGLFGQDALSESRVFVDVSLGLILFELGRRLDIHWMRREKWQFVMGIVESLLSFWLIYLTLRYFQLQPILAAMAAAIGVSTSPAVIMMVAHDMKAEGQVTERALSLVAINSIFSYIAVTMLLGPVHFEYQAHWINVILHPLYLMAGSLLLGYIAHYATLRLAYWLGKQDDLQFIMLVGVIVLTVSLARAMNLSAPLALLAFGIMVKNLDRRYDLMNVEFGHGGQLFFVILFIVTGASLNIGDFAAAGWIALAYIAARFAGKFIAVAALSPLSGLRLSRAGLLSLTLLPLSGTALVMVHDTTTLFPEFGKQMAAIVLSAIAILELAGPIATQFALRRAGEAGADKA